MLGTSDLCLFIAAGATGMTVFGLWRQIATPRDRRTNKKPFGPCPGTTTMAGAFEPDDGDGDSGTEAAAQ